MTSQNKAPKKNLRDSRKKKTGKMVRRAVCIFHIISVREDTYHPWGNVKSMQNFDPKLTRDEAIFMPRFDMTSMLK